MVICIKMALIFCSRSKFASYSVHPGFDPNLCFGDITLTFSHSPHNLSDKERKQMTRKLPEPVAASVKKEEITPAAKTCVTVETSVKM